MIATILGFILFLAGNDPSPENSRKPNPLAPSLPLLTDEEEEKLDGIIDRFMQYDIGKLRGAEGQAARRDFEKLGPEAIPALLRSLNRAARIEHSCPAVVITKKLHRMLMGSQDTELLEFARDEMGAIGRTRHNAVIQDLRVACMLRKNALVRAGIVPPKPIPSMTAAELTAALGKDKETGPRLKEMLGALEQRNGPAVLQGLARAAVHKDKEVQQLARELLDRHLYRQAPDVVKKALRDDDVEVRRSAIRLAAARYPGLAGDLVELLADGQAEVRQAAQQALVALNKGEDLGPAADADEAGRAKAIRKWRIWWDNQKGR